MATDQHLAPNLWNQDLCGHKLGRSWVESDPPNKARGLNTRSLAPASSVSFLQLLVLSQRNPLNLKVTNIPHLAQTFSAQMPQRHAEKKLLCRVEGGYGQEPISLKGFSVGALRLRVSGCRRNFGVRNSFHKNDHEAPPKPEQKACMTSKQLQS